MEQVAHDACFSRLLLAPVEIEVSGNSHRGSFLRALEICVQAFSAFFTGDIGMTVQALRFWPRPLTLTLKNRKGARSRSQMCHDLAKDTPMPHGRFITWAIAPSSFAHSQMPIFTRISKFAT